MSKKKKHKNKVTTQRQPRRLILAKQWMPTYNGKNMVRGYAKHFHVDMLCAIKDLEILGVAISDDYKKAIKRSIDDRARLKQKKKELAKSQTDIEYAGFEDFEFIAGFTSGGMPYGLMREEVPSFLKSGLPDQF